ncbi:hypothetical protein [Mucilaginibacter sp.]|uniref:hypothetical protein n=1 Tax=Mucilaginibacter sp. TaxID=1882438 RepID=UPI002841A5E0|nr:hypothetical protein [Mucilaginibacter sp.]MDR3697724.1 hypothetical protein [Mucilaginibacter sp.]
MTTAFEDSELNTELQELYLEAKQWIADLDFLDSELAFLNKLTGNMTVHAAQKHEVEKLNGIEKAYLGLKEEMHAYLHKLEPLIAQKKENFNIDLIETYTHLKWRLDEVLHSCQTVKNSVFDHSKHGLADENAS